MRVHFIAIGGAAMHNLAIALHLKGMEVSGSDDEVFEPSKSRLKQHGLLPEKTGWHPETLDNNIDAVILGMHARKDNPELLKAQELGLKIYSYPEYVYEMSKDKQRVVIAGSHGKTTITSMVLHVLNFYGKDFDYLVGAQLEGFDNMVKLSDAPVIVLEGDEYLSSPIDLRPKFSWYKPQVALISGIAWDHINVFPTFEKYVEQFEAFIGTIPEDGVLIYFADDFELKPLAKFDPGKSRKIPYETPDYEVKEGKTYLLTDEGKVAVQVFGAHNLQNLQGAMYVCEQIGIPEADFYKAIATFKGAAKRLELIGESGDVTIYKDFAHSPSKLKATVNACKEQFPDRHLLACMELHTFSSLNKNFLPEYKGCMKNADEAIVYYNPHTIEHKRLEAISPEEVREAFGDEKIVIYNDSAALRKYLEETPWKNSVLLFMSSGNYDGIDLNELSKTILGE